ncbi:MAG: hypothetical protein KJ941_01545 [Bacteroidetes bacterium]|nr:hypothetical protein [Bacteroidota bacterium]
MLIQIRNCVFTKILWGLLGLFLLNISVDTTDYNRNNTPEDLSINNQESIIEMVVEQVLGYVDAFKEFDDQDPEDPNKKTNLKIEWFNNYKTYWVIKQLFIGTYKQDFPNLNTFLTKGFEKLDIPPPKA